MSHPECIRKTVKEYCFNTFGQRRLIDNDNLDIRISHVR